MELDGGRLCTLNTAMLLRANVTYLLVTYYIQEQDVIEQPYTEIVQCNTYSSVQMTFDEI